MALLMMFPAKTIPFPDKIYDHPLDVANFMGSIGSNGTFLANHMQVHWICFFFIWGWESITG
jgi:hypothetical protein